MMEALSKGIAATKNEELGAALKAMLDDYIKEEQIIPAMKEYKNIFPELFIQLTQIGFLAGSLSSMWMNLGAACSMAANETRIV